MRHRKTTNKLNRPKDQRIQMLNNLLKSLVKYETIQTTELRYKAVKSEIDKLINFGKAGDNTATRRVFAVLRDKELTDKVINDIAKRHEERNSGYVRSYKMENRPGDNAKIVRIELIK